MLQWNSSEDGKSKLMIYSIEAWVSEREEILEKKTPRQVDWSTEFLTISISEGVSHTANPHGDVEIYALKGDLDQDGWKAVELDDCEMVFLNLCNSWSLTKCVGWSVLDASALD